FVALVKPITMMLKKSMDFKWIVEGKQSFEAIKEAISQDPTLINPDFSKDFILYGFGGNDTISAILVQQNKDNVEQEIAFFRQILEENE
ncbi:hypothetical protein KI387_040040, partial [Taxus chinensis]